MKNRNLLLLSMLVLMTSFFFSCSKDTPVTGNVTTPAVIKDNSNLINNAGRLAPRHHGSIIGVLVPVPAKASIIAFNDQYVSEETNCNQDGSFTIRNMNGASATSGLQSLRRLVSRITCLVFVIKPPLQTPPQNWCH